MTEDLKPRPLPTVAQLAEAVGAHPATIYRAVREGEIRAVHIRGSIRIPWAEYRRLTLGESRCDSAGGGSSESPLAAALAARPRDD